MMNCIELEVNFIPFCLQQLRLLLEHSVDLQVPINSSYAAEITTYRS